MIDGQDFNFNFNVRIWREGWLAGGPFCSSATNHLGIDKETNKQTSKHHPNPKQDHVPSTSSYSKTGQSGAAFARIIPQDNNDTSNGPVPSHWFDCLVSTARQARSKQRVQRQLSNARYSNHGPV